ncbi:MULTISPECIES: hypothetical protein [unclassified Variovorax]|uniref:hypothetical protein n=1 Tax=unclassified Variovorax TaxID=663243 RepID=UPI0025787BF6|nr:MULTISPECIES: hypothetical protein [unclassified Variovorax]MDM0090814.1 hypothetical protein [Variovorax sp. J22G40]MDM0149184.1 hypothetical protein [Variovorax sp. J2P1-31]
MAIETRPGASEPVLFQPLFSIGVFFSVQAPPFSSSFFHGDERQQARAGHPLWKGLFFLAVTGTCNA